MRVVKDRLKAKWMNPAYRPGIAEGVWGLTASGHEWLHNPELHGSYQDMRVGAMMWSNTPSLRWTNQSPEIHAGQDWIVECKPKTPGERDRRRYEPLKVRGLLERFVSIPYQLEKKDETKKAIRAFADEFGLLGVNQAQLKVPGFMLWGERLEDWRARIYHLNLLLRVQKLLAEWSEEADQELTKLLSRGPFLSFSDAEARAEQIEMNLVNGLAAGFVNMGQPSRTVREDMYHLLSAHVNQALDDWSRIHVELYEGASLVVVPANLLGSIYVLFAMEAIGKVPDARPCQAPGCNKLIGNPDIRAIYCSKQCKERAKSANRRAKAREEKPHEQ